MFVQDFQVMDVPFEEVVACLGAGTKALLGTALEGARAEGERLRSKVGPSGWPAVLSKTVEIRSTRLRRHGDCVLLSFCWVASGGASLFPALEGDLEVAPLGEGQTQLVLRGRYEPPGGALGRGLDRLVLHRLAESTIRAFLTSACAALGRQAPQHAAASAC